MVIPLDIMYFWFLFSPGRKIICVFIECVSKLIPKSLSTVSVELPAGNRIHGQWFKWRDFKEVELLIEVWGGLREEIVSVVSKININYLSRCIIWVSLL